MFSLLEVYNLVAHHRSSGTKSCRFKSKLTNSVVRTQQKTDLMIEEDTTISRDLDKWIAKLYDCKPLAEAEVKQLCEQVSKLHHINLNIHTCNVQT